MLLIVSACLLGENCKYNGGSNRSEDLCSLLEGHDLLPLCPECIGGLPTPRPPAEIRGERVINIKGEDVTAYFKAGVDLCLKKIKEFPVDAAILQERSPSCGSGKIYDGSFKQKLTAGDGLFAGALKALKIPIYTLSTLSELFPDCNSQRD